jgi:hypothetical protein
MSTRSEREKERYASDHEYREKRKSNARRYAAANKDKVQTTQKEYRKKNQVHLAETHREWYRSNSEWKLQYDLKKYGLTVEEYNRILHDQDGKCAIRGCNRTGKDEARGSRLHVDHDHKTGAVRGLLCSHCNTGLGKFLDSPDKLQAAIEYLVKNKN